MGLFNLFKRTDKRSVTGSYHPRSEEFARLFGTTSKAGVTVNEYNAETLSAVHNAIQLLTGTVAKMPLIVYERSNGVKSRAVDKKIYRVFHRRPNGAMTPSEFKALIMRRLLLNGDFFAKIETMPDGSIELWPLHPLLVEVKIDTKIGRRVYKFSPVGSDPKVFLDYQVLHIKGNAANEFRGRGVIPMAAEGLARSLAMDGYTSEFFGNSSIPAGILQTPNLLNDEQQKKLKTSWENLNKGEGNRHNVGILQKGVEFKQLSIDPDKTLLLQSRQFEIVEIARWFNLPPHKIKHLNNATFSNIEAQNLEFYQDSIEPWTVRIQDAINLSLEQFASKNSELFAEFLFDSLLVTDTSTRYQAHNTAVQGGWKTPNEVRAIENLNPLPGLDVPFRPLNMGTPQDPAPTEQQKSLDLNGMYGAIVRSICDRIITREIKRGESKKDYTNEEQEEFEGKQYELTCESIEPVLRSLESLKNCKLDDSFLKMSIFCDTQARFKNFKSINLETNSKKLTDLILWELEKCIPQSQS